MFDKSIVYLKNGDTLEIPLTLPYPEQRGSEVVIWTKMGYGVIFTLDNIVKIVYTGLDGTIINWEREFS